MDVGHSVSLVSMDGLSVSVYVRVHLFQSCAYNGVYSAGTALGCVLDSLKPNDNELRLMLASCSSLSLPSPVSSIPLHQTSHPFCPSLNSHHLSFSLSLSVGAVPTPVRLFSRFSLFVTPTFSRSFRVNNTVHSLTANTLSSVLIKSVLICVEDFQPLFVDHTVCSGF